MPKALVLPLLLTLQSLCPMDPNPNEEILYESMPCIRIYKSGRVERFFGSEFTPATADPDTGVISKDVPVDPKTGVSARLYLPDIGADSSKKLPILVYFHGGGFCLGSAFNPTFHNYFNSFVSQARVLVVSVDYRLAPEYPVPAAYEDSWIALKWVAQKPDAWLADHGDFDRLFLGGESAGSNIAHHIAMRVGSEGLGSGMEINGLVMIHPYFMGSKKVESDELNPEASESLASLWTVMCPTTTGIDDPWINPMVEGAPDLAGLGCRRVLVCVGEKDVLRDRGREYYRKLKEGGWKGEVEIWEAVGEGHTFHLFNPTCEVALAQDKTISNFLNR
ncbi:probable carboxylesterase 2 [Typha latifolia]|uniref:probable carboxylesterase 2 n=1 Tax=Typha latifolia TaxID=4733 RepID=UPI003C2FA1C3